jgi:ligand-binding sensor domain-containing protein
VGALAIDTAGALWVATEAGLQRFAGADLTRPGQLFPDQATGLEAASVQTLSPDPDGGLWAGGRGAAYFDGERWTPLGAADGLPGENVQAIAVDDQGRTWFGTDQGLSVWNGAAFFNVAERLALPSNDFRTLLADGDTVWIGTAGGLYRFADNQMQVMTRSNVGLPSDVIDTLALAPDGTLLIGTDGGFAELRDGVVWQVPNFADTAIAHVATAGDEVWVAPASGPVSYSVDAAWEEVSAGDQLPLSAVTALASDGDRVWFGSSHGLVELRR